MVRGVCPKCGRLITRMSPVPIVAVCPCYRICPICGAEMIPYKPNLSPRTYRIRYGFGSDSPSSTGGEEPTNLTLYYCPNHTPPYYSSQPPIEVQLT